jgi:hypothetical protein
MKPMREGLGERRPDPASKLIPESLRRHAADVGSQGGGSLSGSAGDVQRPLERRAAVVGWNGRAVRADRPMAPSRVLSMLASLSLRAGK